MGIGHELVRVRVRDVTPRDAAWTADAAARELASRGEHVLGRAERPSG